MPQTGTTMTASPVLPPLQGHPYAPFYSVNNHGIGFAEGMDYTFGGKEVRSDTSTAKPTPKSMAELMSSDFFDDPWGDNATKSVTIDHDHAHPGIAIPSVTPSDSPDPMIVDSLFMDLGNLKDFGKGKGKAIQGFKSSHFGGPGSFP